MTVMVAAEVTSTAAKAMVEVIGGVHVCLVVPGVALTGAGGVVEVLRRWWQQPLYVLGPFSSFYS